MMIGKLLATLIQNFYDNTVKYEKPLLKMNNLKKVISIQKITFEFIIYGKNAPMHAKH